MCVHVRERCSFNLGHYIKWWNETWWRRFLLPGHTTGTADDVVLLNVCAGPPSSVRGNADGLRWIVSGLFCWWTLSLDLKGLNVPSQSTYDIFFIYRSLPKSAFKYLKKAWINMITDHFDFIPEIFWEPFGESQGVETDSKWQTRYLRLALLLHHSSNWISADY